MAWRLAQKDLSLHWRWIAVSLGMVLLHLPIFGLFGAPADLLDELLLLSAFVFCWHLPQAVAELPEPTMSFVMSLPISVREYAAGKILANLAMFLFPSALVLAASIFIAWRAARPELIPSLVLLFFGCLAAYCVLLGFGLVAESSFWICVALLLLMFSNFGSLLQALAGADGASPGPAPSGRQLALLALLLAATALSLVLGFYLRCRREGWRRGFFGRKRRRGLEIPAARTLAAPSFSSWSLVRRLVLRDFFVNRRRRITILAIDLLLVGWQLFQDSLFEAPISAQSYASGMAWFWIFVFHLQLVDDLRLQRMEPFSALLPISPRIAVAAHLLGNLVFFLVPTAAVTLAMLFRISQAGLPAPLIPLTFLLMLGPFAGFCLALGFGTFGQRNKWSILGMCLGLLLLFAPRLAVRLMPGSEAPLAGSAESLAGIGAGWPAFLLVLSALSLALPLLHPYRHPRDAAETA